MKPILQSAASQRVFAGHQNTCNIRKSSHLELLQTVRSIRDTSRLPLDTFYVMLPSLAVPVTSFAPEVLLSEACM